MAQRPFSLSTLAHAIKPYNWPKYAQSLLPLGSFSACRLCGSGDAQDGICVACTADLPWFLPSGSHLRKPHALDYLQVAMRYEFPINQLIAAAKYHGDLGAARILGRLLASRLSDWECPEVIVPIPMPWPRYLLRGYNHTLIIANAIAANCASPVANNLLRRHGWQRPQRDLSRRERLKNLRDAFVVKQSLNGRHVVLVDDVITTGVTLRAAARVLRLAGAARIGAWVIAAA